MQQGNGIVINLPKRLHSKITPKNRFNIILTVGFFYFYNTKPPSMFFIGMFLIWNTPKTSVTSDKMFIVFSNVSKTSINVSSIL